MTHDEEIEFHMLNFFRWHGKPALSSEMREDLSGNGILIDEKIFRRLIDDKYLDSDRNAEKTHFVYTINEKGRNRLNRLKMLMEEKEKPSIHIAGDVGNLNTGTVGNDQVSTQTTGEKKNWTKEIIIGVIILVLGAIAIKFLHLPQ